MKIEIVSEERLKELKKEFGSRVIYIDFCPDDQALMSQFRLDDDGASDGHQLPWYTTSDRLTKARDEYANNVYKLENELNKLQKTVNVIQLLMS